MLHTEILSYIMVMHPVFDIKACALVLDIEVLLYIMVMYSCVRCITYALVLEIENVIIQNSDTF